MNTTQPRPFVIVIPIYPGVTHLDFTGPHQFFSRLPDTRVIVASMDGAPVEADGLVFAQLQDLAQLSECDVLCVPGGAGCASAMLDQAFLERIRVLASRARYITSVCTGSLILGAAGLLKGKRAACHWAWRDFLAEFGALPDESRVAKDGNIITGGGVTAGIDFSLVVISEIFGEQAAQMVQLGLEYAPAPPFSAGRPDTAPAVVVSAVKARMDESLSGRRDAVHAAAQRLLAA